MYRSGKVNENEDIEYLNLIKFKYFKKLKTIFILI